MTMRGLMTPLALASCALSFVGCSSAHDGPAATPPWTGTSKDAGSLKEDASMGLPSDDAGTDAPPLADDAAPPGPGAEEGGADRSVRGDDGGSADAMADSAAGDGANGPGPNVPPYTGPPRPPALCSPSSVWSAGALLDISTPLDDAFAAITPDELTIAWTVGSGAGAMIHYADRAKSTDPFGPPQSLSASLFADDRVALSPDGLRLVVVNQDRQGFSELSRTAPNTAFGAPAVGSYSGFDVPGVLSPGEAFGDPVLSEDDAHFVYSVYGAGRTSTIFQTSRVFLDEAWQVGFPVRAGADLTSQGAMRRRPTALSLDQNTLFFWDEVTGTERAAWMNDATGVFDAFVTLGARAGAAPDATCHKLYYSAPGTASVDLFVALN